MSAPENREPEELKEVAMDYNNVMSGIKVKFR